MQFAGKASGRKRLVAAAAAVAGVVALMTAAAFTDFANLNIGNGTDNSGIGGNNLFDIKVVGTDTNGNPVPGTWQDADTVDGVNLNVPGADLLTPDDSVSVEIPFKNVSPVLKAQISLTLQDRPNKTSGTLISAALRYTVELDGKVLADEVPQSAIQDLDLGQYDNVNGPKNQAVLKITITLPDQGSAILNNKLQGEVSYVQVHFDATSFK